MEKMLSLLPLMLLVILALFSTTLSFTQTVSCFRCHSTDNPGCGIPFDEMYSRIERCTRTYCYMNRGEYKGRFTLYDIFFRLHSKVIAIFLSKLNTHYLNIAFYNQNYRLLVILFNLYFVRRL